MNRKTLLLARPLRHAAVVLALLASAASAQTAHAPDTVAAFDAALLAHERNHWDEAYAALVRLADRGHPDAARMAQQMWRYGPQLYGTAFKAQPEQVARWTKLPGCAESRTSPCTAAVAAR